MRNKEDFIGYEDGRTESVHKVRCGENLISSIEFKDEYSALYSALDDLTDKQRERIILNYINGLSERKIKSFFEKYPLKSLFPLLINEGVIFQPLLNIEN